jgi:hypothetical protein
VLGIISGMSPSGTKFEALLVRKQRADHPPETERAVADGELGRARAEQGSERLLELAGRDTLQVEPGQQLLDVLRPPQERRQHLRGEADAFAACVPPLSGPCPLCQARAPSVREVGATVAELRPAHRDRADAGLDLALGRVPVADKAPAAVRVLEPGGRPEKCLNHGLDDLLQHPPRSRL